MAADIIRKLLNRDPRYIVTNGDGLTVTISDQDESSESLAAQLIDIGVAGAKLRVPCAPEVEEVFQVKIEAVEPKRVVTLSGEVCWVSPATGEDWLIGCTFSPLVPEKMLLDFAVRGMLDRRDHTRHPVSLPATAERELDGTVIDVEVLDYSRGGFCLLSQHKGKTGERILLQLVDDEGMTVEIPGKVQWQYDSPNGFIDGCEFVVERDFIALRHLVGGMSGETQRLSWRRILGGLSVAGANSDTMSSWRMKLSLAAMIAVVLIGAAFGWSWLANDSTPVDRSTETHLTAAHTAVTTSASVAAVDEAIADIADILEPNMALGERSVTAADTPSESEPVTSPRIPTASQADSNPNQNASDEDVVDVTRDPWMLTQAAATLGPANDSHPVLGDPSSANTDTTLKLDLTADLALIDAQTVAEQQATRNVADPREQQIGGFRTWVDNSGKFQVVAKIEAVQDNVVKLRKKNGNFALAPVDRLSPNDVQFVRQWLKANGRSSQE